MTPQIKQVLRKVQSEYFRKEKSLEWRKLKSSFRKLKQKYVRAHFSNLVTQLKSTNKGSFYKQVKLVTGAQSSGCRELHIECLEAKTDLQCAEELTRAFAAVSNQFQPVYRGQQPAYLSALPPPQVTQLEVYTRLRRLKNTRSTLPIDIPIMLRKEVAFELSEPPTHIINVCLKKQKFPSLWKIETVSPVLKVEQCRELTDVRKIACTSDYKKLYEGFLKDWILEDIRWSKGIRHWTFASFLGGQSIEAPWWKYKTFYGYYEWGGLEPSLWPEWPNHKRPKIHKNGT